jgi:MFS family permease
MEFDKRQKLFFAANTIISLGMAISITFFNIFIYRYTNNSLNMMILLNCIRFGFLPFVFAMGSIFSRRIGIIKLFAMSMVSYIIMLVSAIVLSSENVLQPVMFIILIGLMWAFSEGLYYLCSNMLQQILAEDRKRASFVSIATALTSVASIVAPMLSTFLISIFGQAAYAMIFIIIALFDVIAFVIAVKIDVPKEENLKIKFIEKGIFKKQPKLKSDFLMNVTFGFRDGIQFGLISIMYINAFKNNDVFYGIFSTVIAAFTILSYTMASRIYKRSHKNKPFIICSVFMVVSACIFGINGSMISAIIYGIIFNLTVGICNVPIVTKSFKAIEECSKGHGDRLVNTTRREFAINLGRVLSLISSLILSNLFDNGVNIAFTISFLSMVVSTIFYYKHK